MASAPVLALDYGAKRIGVAISATASLARPLTTLDNSVNLLSEIREIIASHEAEKLVIGLPRNLSGDDTGQTAEVRRFADLLKSKIEIPVYLVDEAGTSVEAETRLAASKKTYKKGDVDALAAALILEDFLSQ